MLHDYPVHRPSAVLQGRKRVEIRDSDGSMVEARDNPREAFRSGRLLRWDAIDFAYFCGYAMWNYMNLPFLLADSGVMVTEFDERTSGTRLQVRYPDTIPTHSATQELYFDQSGRLVRHDYTAEVVGSWAKAAICAAATASSAGCGCRRSGGSTRVGRATGRCRCRRWWPSTSTTCSRAESGPDHHRTAARPRMRPSNTNASRVTSSRTVVHAAAWNACPRSVSAKMVTGNVFHVAG